MHIAMDDNMIHEHFEVGEWVKYVGHSRYGRVKATQLYTYARHLYNETTYGTDGKESTFVSYYVSAGEQILTVDRPTRRGGVYVMVEQRWGGDQTEHYTPTERIFQTWALAVMRS